MLIRVDWKALSRQDLGEHGAGVMVFDIPLGDSFSQEAGVLFRPQEKLDRLPHDPSLSLQRRHGGICKGSLVSVVERLQTVQTA